MLGNVIGGFVVIVVATALLPIVANQVVAAQTGNVTGAASTLVGLTTLFYSLAIATVAIAIAANGLRQANLV